MGVGGSRGVAEPCGEVVVGWVGGGDVTGGWGQR